jgi:polyhydroxybutyrate depolymerase
MCARWAAVAVVCVFQVAAVARASPAPDRLRHFDRRSIEVDGRERSFIAYRPRSASPGSPAVVLLHGGGQSMTRVLREDAVTSRWLELADAHGLVLLVPNGTGLGTGLPHTDRQGWNDIRAGASPTDADDVSFIASLVEWSGRELPVDPGRVFITGSSNGGMMAYFMLVERPGLFAAGAAFIANMPAEFVPVPTEGTPVMICNGDADPLMPWAGGGVGFGGAGAPVRSTPATVAYWASANGLETEPLTRTVLPDLDPGDGCRVIREEYGVAPGVRPGVVFYRVVNGGHAIPVPGADGFPEPPAGAIGWRCGDVRGVDLAWAFMSLWDRPERGSGAGGAAGR